MATSSGAKPVTEAHNVGVSRVGRYSAVTHVTVRVSTPQELRKEPDTAYVLRVRCGDVEKIKGFVVISDH